MPRIILSAHPRLPEDDMEGIRISEQDVVSLDPVAPSVYGLRIMLVNVFGVAHADGTWTLVDAGLPFSSEYIRAWAQKHFGEMNPRSIVLTHGHFDHVGGLKTLAETWDVPVYCHALEIPYVTGKKEYPAPDPTVGGGVMSVMAPLYPRGPVDLGSRAIAFSIEGSVPDLPGWRWIHTPGHTDGHISFFRDQDRVLLVGDAFCTTDQESALAIAQQRPELHGPPAYYTSDWDAAKRSVENLAALRPAIVAPGHGRPMSEVADELELLARDFDRVARPKHGRYVA